MNDIATVKAYLRGWMPAIAISAGSFWGGAIVQDSFTTYVPGGISPGVPGVLPEMCMCKMTVYSPEVSPIFAMIVFIAIIGIGWWLRGWLGSDDE